MKETILIPGNCACESNKVYVQEQKTGKQTKARVVCKDCEQKSDWKYSYSDLNARAYTISQWNKITDLNRSK
jgi:hypothetical protein